MAHDRIKRMSVKEFRELGLLQELNRQFLHPMGLALEIIQAENGIERFGEVWDSRADPEGIFFEPTVLSREKGNQVKVMFEAKRQAREKEWGTHVQKFIEDYNES